MMGCFPSAPASSLIISGTKRRGSVPPCRAGHIGVEVMLLIAVIVLFTVAVAIGVFFFVPPAEGLGALVRIAFFHIPMAWVAVLAFFQNAWWGAAFLRRNDFAADVKSAAAAKLGLIFTLLATGSGALFAKLTWGRTGTGILGRPRFLFCFSFTARTSPCGRPFPIRAAGGELRRCTRSWRF